MGSRSSRTRRLASTTTRTCPRTGRTWSPPDHGSPPPTLPTLDLPRHARPAPEAAREGARDAIRQTGVTPRWVQRRRSRKPRTPAPPSDGDDEPGDRGTVLAAPGGQAVGSYVGLCLLIRFPDVADTIPDAEISLFCNAAGYSGFGNNGSVRDYFRAVSDGRLDYTNIVTGYITAKHPRAHYTDPTVSFGTRAQQLVREGLKRLKAQGFDFSPAHCGLRGLRPGPQRLLRGTDGQRLERGAVAALLSPGPAVRRASGRTFSDYQITNIGSEITLRTFCHENGHMICDFPDLYDYGYESNGVGDFCLMCSGGSDTDPVEVCAYLKHQAGWTSTISELGAGATFSLAAGTQRLPDPPTQPDRVLHPREPPARRSRSRPARCRDRDLARRRDRQQPERGHDARRALRVLAGAGRREVRPGAHGQQRRCRGPVRGPQAPRVRCDHRAGQPMVGRHPVGAGDRRHLRERKHDDDHDRRRRGGSRWPTSRSGCAATPTFGRCRRR